jgi:hypothetical protein
MYSAVYSTYVLFGNFAKSPLLRRSEAWPWPNDPRRALQVSARSTINPIQFCDRVQVLAPGALGAPKTSAIKKRNSTVKPPCVCVYAVGVLELDPTIENNS